MSCIKQKSNLNIVITSTSYTDRAESFVEAHKKYIRGNIYYLYGNNLPVYGPGHMLLGFYPKGIRRLFRKVLKFCGKKYDIPIIEGIEKYLQKNNIDIVLSEFGTTGAEMAPICYKLGIPHIIHFHGGDAVIKSIIDNFKQKYQFMFKHANAIIAVSNDMKADLAGIGAPKSKIIINPYGAESFFSQINPSFDTPYFIFIGRFVDKKAPYYLMYSFKEVTKRIPTAHLGMIGEGPLLNACKNMAKFLEINNKVSFLGKVNHDILPEYLKKSCCYVQHSIVAENGDSEGTPVSILESSLAGIPIVSTRHKGINDVVIHGETGFLVDEHDVSSMAKYMIQIGSDMQLAQLMGKKAREYVEKNYSIVKHINILNKIIEEAVRK